MFRLGMNVMNEKLSSVRASRQYIFVFDPVDFILKVRVCTANDSKLY